MQQYSKSLNVLSRVIGALIYSILISFLASFTLKTLKGEENGVTSKHSQSIRSLIIEPSKKDRLSNIGGLSNVKKELKRWVLMPLKYPEIFYTQPSVRPANGILLHGPPGTGKTMLAKAVASESNVPFISLHSAGLESKWFGESPKLLNAAFTLARTELAPCIIFFDEIDALGRTRTEMDQSCVYSLKCELLRNMDGIEHGKDAPVIVMACTNCVHSLDSALRRRFGRVIHIEHPNEKERYDILLKLTRNDAIDTSVLQRVASASKGMTGAELAALYSEASMCRMNGSSIEDNIEKGNIQNGTDLVRHLGEITWEHWISSGRLKVVKMEETKSST